MLAHPNVRLTPLELLALNKMTELLPRILEKSLLMNNAFHFNSSKTVNFSFKKREEKPKYMLIDTTTKKQVSPPLYTYRQLSHLVSQQNPRFLKYRKKNH
jgi:hypothetical protein